MKAPIRRSTTSVTVSRFDLRRSGPRLADFQRLADFPRRRPDLRFRTRTLYGEEKCRNRSGDRPTQVQQTGLLSM
jgi:hypothetical protein